MDSSEKDNFVMEKESGGDHLNYHESNISSEWRFAGGLHLANPQIGLVATDNPVGNPPIGSPSCSSVSVADAFCPSLWNHHHGSENLGFGESNIQTTASAPNAASARKSVFGSSSSGMAKTADLGWNPSASKGGVFMQPGSGVLPQSLSQFPSDSDFIERAARLSCFNNGNFSDMVNPFSMPVSLSSYAKGGVQAPEFQSENRMKGVIPGMHSLKINLLGKEAVKDVSAPVDHGAIEGLRREIESGDVLKPSEEVKHGVQGLSHGSNEAELSGNGQDDPSGLKNTVGEPSAKGASAKKRKRGDQDLELDQAKGASELLAAAQLSSETSKDNVENKQKAEYTSTPGAKHTGKNGKDSSQNSDPPKDDYIHVRARRGQATNSHSLAERVRREKISERMKFLQDLVPGCSKVTGKAVMLDEIINYVQSLQRQVEFLSMKLATVNPRLDFNIEGLAKDVFQPRTGASSSIGFPSDISTFHPHMHPSQQGLIQASIPGMENPTDSLRRTISSQLAAINGYKDLSSQITNVWDDDLHNVVQMSFGMNATFNSQESNVAESMKSVHKPLIYREKGDKRVWTISRPTAVVGGRLLLTANESDTTQASSCTANEA